MKVPVSAIPHSDGRLVTNADMADNADIRRAIINAVPQAVEQTKELSKYFSRTSPRETCKVIFDFLKNDVNYVADGSIQLIKLPSALLKTRIGDCKSYSIFTSAILTNLGIPHHFQMVSYNADPTPSHIYVTTDDGCIIDAVWGKFDDEKQPTYRYKVKPNGKMMKVQTMTGIGSNCSAMGSIAGCGCGCGCNSCKGMNGLFGKRDPNKKALKQAERDARRAGRDACGRQGLKPVTLAAGRTLFLLIVKNNLDGFASKLSKMNAKQVADSWCNVGGNPYSLQEAIKKGASRKAKRLGLLGKLAKKAGIKINGVGMNGLSVEQKKAVTSALTGVSLSTATAVGTMVGQPEKGAAAGVSFASVMTAITPLVLGALQMMLPQEAGDQFSSQTDLDLSEDNTDLSPDEFPVDTGTDTGAGAGTGTGTGTGTGSDDKKGSNVTMYLLLGAVAAGAYFIFRKK